MRVKAGRRQPPGPLQDANTRRYDAPNDASTERDARWLVRRRRPQQVHELDGWLRRGPAARLYSQNKPVWTDDFNIPSPAMACPTCWTKFKGGLDWLVRMQEADGSVLSIQGLASASSPSASTPAPAL